MNKYKFAPLLLMVAFLQCASNASKPQLRIVGKLPLSLKEVSGMVTLQNQNPWVLEDSGNKNRIYKIDKKGNKLKSITLEKSVNRDWEALTKDTNDNLYIGDFGNNSNKRRDLTIYKIANPEETASKKMVTEKIYFSYPDQDKFPPKSNKFKFDAEGFICFKHHLYIFSKNKAKPFDGKTTVYKIPNKPGSYIAQKIGAIFLGNNKHSIVTDVALSPDRKTIAILTNNNIQILENFDLEKFTIGKKTILPIVISTQMESICFLNSNTLLLADEDNGNGGNLYKVMLRVKDGNKK